MKLNLGCGADLRPYYINVDLREVLQDPKIYRREDCSLEEVDLSKTPWPWPDSSVSEILMLDVLEHFSYRHTRALLDEAWRVLKPEGVIHVQVPDFDVCARAAVPLYGQHTQCNVCGFLFEFEGHGWTGKEDCTKCGAKRIDIKTAAIHRLYGGQDKVGNWHFNAFTKESLQHQMADVGFGDFEFLEFNENGETFAQNWNMRLRAVKKDGWT